MSGGEMIWTAFKFTGALFSSTNAAAGYVVGAKFVQSISRREGEGSFAIEVHGTMNSSWGGAWNSAGSYVLPSVSYSVAKTSVVNKDVHLRNFYLNTANGVVHESDIILSFAASALAASTTPIASFQATYVGQVGQLDTRLWDLDKFWDPNGRFLLDDPQTITVIQGNGRQTAISIYSNDTLGDLARKLNDAIANGLNQAKYTRQSSVNNFVSYVTNATSNTVESVPGTMVIRSAVSGSDGEIRFAASEEIINALSLNTIQNAVNNEFFVSIADAHSGTTIKSNERITNNIAYGLLHPNLDFEFDAMADLEIAWNDATKRFDMTAAASVYSTIIHVADNTAIFQIGANEGEDMSIDIADMSCAALGLDRIVVTNRDSAARAITIIDTAIDRVSSQRAKLGAYQNRLEHTVNNLNTASENLTAAESRIRDLDLAKEMMNFTKLNILTQSGMSMLAQANQMPSSILSLLQ
jgi:flagellin